jgi:hypothetical protein
VDDIHVPVELSYQNAPSAACPAEKIAECSLIPIANTFDFLPDAFLSSSEKVDALRLTGE